MVPLVFAFYGLIIGSFLNVLILRRATRSLAGRSGCLSCGENIRARDLVPVVSWLLLSGRCRSCGSTISIQYLLVEASTALLFALLGAAGLWGIPLVIALVIVALFIAIAAYDIRHTIIPDEWAYAAAGAALIYALLESPHPLTLALLAGPVAALPLFALWIISRGRWMGLGDSKLALSIGFLLGPVYGVYAVFFAFIVGAVVSVAVLLPLPTYRRVLQKTGIVPSRALASYTMKSEVPFGPFLILSCFIVWFSLLYNLPLLGALF